jgi:hypothetical protein
VKTEKDNKGLYISLGENPNSKFDCMRKSKQVFKISP